MDSDISNPYLLGINYIICFYFIIQRIIVFNWIWKNKEKYDNHEDKLYQKFGIFLPFRLLFTYTNYGNTLCFFNSLYFILYNQQPFSFVFPVVWTLVFSVTAGYWVLVYPFKNHSLLPINMNLEISGHGPLLILNSLSLYLYQYPVFELHHILYTIYFNLFWLLCIWMPWYFLTGDYIYFVFKPNFPVFFKINIVIKMCLLSLMGFMIAHLIEFKV